VAGNAPRSLLDRRLVIVTGKGGTGKTTVTAALAVAAARTGRRVLVAEMASDEQVVRLLAPGAPPVGYAGRQVMPGVDVQQIDPFEALSEYLVLQIGVRPLVETVMNNRAFRQLMSASPGWRELITLGKIWHVEQMPLPDGTPKYDLILVDAPATGHGVTFLDVPRVVVSAVRAGLLHNHTDRVEALIADPERTVLLPVTTAEELPARETAELVDRVRSDLGIAIDRVVINAVATPPFPAGLEDLDTRLGRLPESLSLGGLPAPKTLAACAGYLRARYELNQRFIGEIAEDTRLPVVLLPLIPTGIEGPTSIASLAEPLVEEPMAEAV
jgi:anion-transporting  ArsA/GET3 family ATPase